MIRTTKPKTLKDLTEAYQLVRPLAPSSINQHRYALNCFARFLGRKPLLTDLVPDTVNQYLVWMQLQGLNPATISSKRRVLLALWRFGHEAYYLKRLPERIRKVPVRHAQPIAWTVDDLRAFLTMIEGMRGKSLHCHRVDRADFWLAFVLVGSLTGLRLSDLMLLEFKHIEPTGWLAMIQKKTGFPIRCYLPPEAIQAINAIALPKRLRVFGDLMSKKCLQENYAKLVTRAGLRGSIKTLRKTAATMAECAQPGSASWLLGHRDANIARRHYIDPTQVMQTAPQLPTLRLG